MISLILAVLVIFVVLSYIYLCFNIFENRQLRSEEFRIKKYIMVNDTIKYGIQTKFGFMWCDLIEYYNFSFGGKKLLFDSEDNLRQFIKNEMARLNEEKSNKIKKSEILTIK